MVPYNILKTLVEKTESKIVLLVMDGIGGLPNKKGKTEIEIANTPNLDYLTKNSICGVTDPINYGITPGSGPAHLALFGYDPMEYEIGRGVLEALGIGLHLTSKDLASRANFATLKDGKIVDRRAGRISTEKNIELCELLQRQIKRVDDVEVIIKPGKEHRFVVIFRGEGLEGHISDADPQKEGLPPKSAIALERNGKKSAAIVNKFINQVNSVLKGHLPANTCLLRGIAKVPPIPSMSDLFKLTPCAIATYPMYKGLARLVGMEVIEGAKDIKEEFNILKENYIKYDFFYIHIKKTDSFGEDGNVEEKIKVIEKVDRYIPEILNLKPDVFVVTADHSTPCELKSHSWHPNPVVLYSRFIRKDNVKRFSERTCVNGGLGRFPAKEIMILMLAYALKLKKFGA